MTSVPEPSCTTHTHTRVNNSPSTQPLGQMDFNMFKPEHCRTKSPATNPLDIIHFRLQKQHSPTFLHSDCQIYQYTQIIFNNIGIYSSYLIFRKEPECLESPLLFSRINIPNSKHSGKHLITQHSKKMIKDNACM